MTSKEKIKDLLLVLNRAIDKDDLKLIDIVNMEVHIKLQNYTKYFGKEIEKPIIKDDKNKRSGGWDPKIR